MKNKRKRRRWKKVRDAEAERKGAETEKKRRRWRKEKGAKAEKRLKNKEGRR